MVWKDRKAFCADIKTVYGVVNKQAAEQALEKLDATWGNKYKHAIALWRTNRDSLTCYFDFPLEIRKIIYTTSTIENLNLVSENTPKQKRSLPMLWRFRKPFIWPS